VQLHVSAKDRICLRHNSGGEAVPAAVSGPVTYQSRGRPTVMTMSSLVGCVAFAQSRHVSRMHRVCAVYSKRCATACASARPCPDAGQSCAWGQPVKRKGAWILH